LTLVAQSFNTKSGLLVSQNRDQRLPHNASGMDFDNFAWEIRPDGKLHLFSKSYAGRHLTLHPGTKSGVLDLHETLVNLDGAKSHNTLFMIKSEDLIKLAEQIGPVLISGLLQQFRPLSLRWLRRRKIAVVRQPASTDAELAAITSRNARKRLRFDMQMLEEALETLHAPDELLRMSDGMFGLLAVRRWGTRCIGFGIKATDRTGAVHLRWTRPEEFAGWMKQMDGFVKEVAARYRIPQQDYPMHTLL
jgi:hypothetical protein